MSSLFFSTGHVSTTSLLSRLLQRSSSLPLVSFTRKVFCNHGSSLLMSTTTAAPTSIINTFGGGTPHSMGSELGSDSSMIAANHRQNSFYSTTTATATVTSTSDASSISSHEDSNNDNAAANSSSSMKDEYGEMTADGATFAYGDYVLENGQVLEAAQLRYQTYGELNETRDNVLVVCHALTGNASLHAWWGDLLGEGRAFDTSKYFVVCCNILGSCYGSTAPTSIRPSTGRAYGKDFPDISVKDTVRLQLLLLQQELQVESVKAVIGGSFGGMQAVEFAVQAGSSDAEFTTVEGAPYVRSVIPIACGAEHTAWQIAISEVQRQAIYADPAWDENGFDATKGLAVARQMGMVSYRTPKGYREKFGRRVKDSSDAQYGSGASWQVKSYLEYQGYKFLSRFDPITYVKMTEQMDTHDVARNRKGNIQDVLGRVEIPALVLGIDSDVLYPLQEQQVLAKALPLGTLQIITSDDGHDGFLLEQEQVAGHITDFLEVHA